LRRSAIAAMRHAGRVGSSQLQRVELVVVPGAQIDRIALTATFGQSIDVDEEVEALLEPVGQQLDMTEMGDIETGLAHGRFSFPFGAVRLLKRLSQPASGRQRKLGQMGCVTNSPV